MSSDQFRVRLREVSDLSDADLRAWVALESRAAEPNVYLSPLFVLPALRHLDPGVRARVLWVDAGEGPDALRAVGVVQPSLGTRAFPWPHLQAYACGHAYLGGLMVDRAQPGAVLAALQRHLDRPMQPWCGLELPKVDAAGALVQAVAQIARRADAHAPVLGLQERAMLDLTRCGEDLLRDTLGKKLNEINRCMRRLAEMGEVTWHCHREQIPEEVIEAFLHLEHLGWKGEAGTSLRASAADEAFFRDMVAGFDREGRALFTELRLDGRTVASTCNFVSGGMGFAFKVGWDPELRKLGPGMLNEVEFIRRARDHCPDLLAFDSGASADSFINRLWPGRRSLGLLVWPAGRLATAVVGASCRLREARHARRAVPTSDKDVQWSSE